MGVLVNDAIKGGVWRHYISPGDMVNDVLETVKKNYDLGEFVSDRLVMGYNSYGQDGKKVEASINDDCGGQRWHVHQ